MLSNSHSTSSTIRGPAKSCPHAATTRPSLPANSASLSTAITALATASESVGSTRRPVPPSIPASSAPPRSQRRTAARASRLQDNNPNPFTAASALWRPTRRHEEAGPIDPLVTLGVGHCPGVDGDLGTPPTRVRSSTRPAAAHHPITTDRTPGTAARICGDARAITSCPLRRSASLATVAMIGSWSL